MKFYSFLLFLFFTQLVFAQEFLIKHEGKTNILNAGGRLEIERLFNQEMEYPMVAYKSETEGYVQFNFNLSQIGTVSNLEISGDNLETFEKLGVDLFKKLIWLPTNKRPQNYPVEFVIIYNPKKFKKLLKKRGDFEINKPAIEFSGNYQPINFNEVEEKPTPIFTEGSYRSPDHYFNSKIKYPESAIRLGLSGPVTLEYIIEVSGNVTNINIVEPLGGGCNEEAIRVLTSLKWKAGVQENKSYRVKAKTTMTFGRR